MKIVGYKIVTIYFEPTSILFMWRLLLQKAEEPQYATITLKM